jgi:ElaB/YqjD/DUF883 family membrane-anchored ribosome-binding protein
MTDQKVNGKQETKKRSIYAAVGLILGSAVGFTSGGPVGAGIGAAIGLLLGAAIDRRQA